VRMSSTQNAIPMITKETFMTLWRNTSVTSRGAFCENMFHVALERRVFKVGQKLKNIKTQGRTTVVLLSSLS